MLWAKSPRTHIRNLRLIVRTLPWPCLHLALLWHRGFHIGITLTGRLQTHRYTSSRRPRYEAAGTKPDSKAWRSGQLSASRGGRGAMCLHLQQQRGHVRVQNRHLIKRRRQRARPAMDPQRAPRRSTPWAPCDTPTPHCNLPTHSQCMLAMRPLPPGPAALAPGGRGPFSTS